MQSICDRRRRRKLCNLNFVSASLVSLYDFCLFVQERGRLRHRQGGKFAKQAKIFSKYDDEVGFKWDCYMYLCLINPKKNVSFEFE